ncbi:hypothetical protein FACS1894147_02180 [Spirochaetia bacterium]|nr:hypothetical protein FACS1894147_02180 [Spirochaetia bacterium]
MRNIETLKKIYSDPKSNNGEAVYIQGVLDKIRQKEWTKARAKYEVNEYVTKNCLGLPDGGQVQACWELIDEYPDTMAGTAAPQISSTLDRKPTIFLSHRSSDQKYADALEKFICGLGVKTNQLIYTSHPLHGIPLDENIFGYLRKKLNENVHVVFLWSNEYLESSACLIEVGAAWIAQKDYTHVFVPDFDFSNQKFQECGIDAKRKGIILNGDVKCKSAMIEFKSKISNSFNLTIDEKELTYLLDNFMLEILKPRNQIASLEIKHTKLKNAMPEDTEMFAQGDTNFEMHFIISNGYETLLESSLACTWNEIFAKIAPLMINEAREESLSKALDDLVTHLYIKKLLKGLSVLDFLQITIEDFQTIKVQLREFGLIKTSVKHRSLKDASNTYWTLTPYGDNVMTRLLATKRMAAQNNETK